MKIKKGTKVIASGVSDEVGRVAHYDQRSQLVDIKYPRSKGMVVEHVSRVKIV